MDVVDRILRGENPSELPVAGRHNNRPTQVVSSSGLETPHEATGPDQV